MIPGGGLAAEIVTADGVITDVRTLSSRRVPLAAALRGKPAAEALALVPLLFAACGITQGLAASAAVDAALERTAHQGAERAWARAILVASEVVDGHAWSILTEWPPLSARPPGLERLRAFRKATSELRNAVDPSLASLRTGPCALQPDRTAIAHCLREIDALTHEIAGDLPDDAAGLVAWAGRSLSPAAPLVRQVLGAGEADLGASEIPMLPFDLDAAWLGARLGADPAFGERPTVDGWAHEAGPVARALARKAPLVVSTALRHGRGALARIAARLVELAAATAHLTAVAEERAEASAAAGAGSGGVGCGIADSARGRLAHWVAVDGTGVVTDWRFVAPTEWTFHPDGAFRRGLVGRRVRDATHAAQAVRLHLALLDPCVPCRIDFRDAGER